MDQAEVPHLGSVSLDGGDGDRGWGLGVGGWSTTICETSFPSHRSYSRLWLQCTVGVSSNRNGIDDRFRGRAGPLREDLPVSPKVLLRSPGLALVRTRCEPAEHGGLRGEGWLGVACFGTDHPDALQ